MLSEKSTVLTFQGTDRKKSNSKELTCFAYHKQRMMKHTTQSHILLLMGLAMVYVPMGVLQNQPL